MPRVVRWLHRHSLAVLVCAVALLAACADFGSPSTAPRPIRRSAQCEPGQVCPTFGFTCASGASDACECNPTSPCCRVGEPCTITLPIDPPRDSATAPRVHILSAHGPNVEGSFTTLPAERTLGLTATATPGQLAPSIAWTVTDDPTDDAQGVAPTGPLSSGPLASVDLPRQTTARWHAPHGAPLSARALAFRVVAALPSGGAGARDSVVVRQRELDVLRQEYVDFGIPVPGPADVRAAADVAGLTRFAWTQLNQGDYGMAVLTPLLLAKLDELDATAGRTLSLSSVFRNPAHHRFHVSVSGGAATALLSQHQYGTAVDIRTYRNTSSWNRLHDVVKRAGACAEPLNISTSDHVHADWRTGAPRCPKGW